MGSLGVHIFAKKRAAVAEGTAVVNSGWTGSEKGPGATAGKYWRITAEREKVGNIWPYR